VVSTDDAEIAEVARWFGADVPFLRPAELAQDLTPSRPVVLHALDWYAAQGESFDEVVLLQPTTPLTSVADVRGCIDLFRTLGGPSVVSVTEPRDPVDFHLVMDGSLLKPAVDSKLVFSRQERAEEVCLATSVYVCSPEWLRSKEHWLVPGETHGYRVSPERALDIDEEFELASNEALYRRGVPWADGRVMVIAEAGVNHNGDMARALEMIDVAAEAGADAVKFQIYHTEEYCAATAPQADYQKRNTGSEESMQEMMRGFELSPEQLRELVERCRSRGVMFSASMFDLTAVRELDALDPPFMKVPSGEITNRPLLEAVARTLRPVVLSTGMSTLAEVASAVDILRENGTEDLALLHCTSDYPASIGECNLSAMAAMASAFHVPVGYSDHTIGHDSAVAAVALGARVLEKHFTLDKSLVGPDHKASADPAEFAAYVGTVRNMEAALGTGIKRPSESERATAAAARKSLVAARRLPEGHRLCEGDMVCKRPGTGLSPMLIDVVVGRSLKRDVPPDHILRWGDLA